MNFMKLDPGQIEVMDDRIAEILKKKTPAERLKTAFELWDMAQHMISAHLKSLHPEWNTKEIQQEVAHRMSHGAV